MKVKNKIKLSMVLALLLPLLYTSNSALKAEDSGIDQRNVSRTISAAKTAADHEALAAYYEKQATEAKEIAENHLKMAQDYEKSPYLQSAGPDYLDVYVGHCKAMARNYESIAADDEALAKMHREMAKKVTR